jgi:hypothetical protein
MPVASPYFAMLDGVLTHMGGAPVVRLMAADITARRFDDPGHAVTSVHKIAWPHLALSQIEGGSAEPEGVRDLFDGDAPGIMALEPADRPTALAHLIGLADPQDRRRIDTWTPIIGRDDPIPVLKALASVARKLMWQQERIGVRGYLRLADELGHADPFLAALMRPPAGVDELESGLGQASQLLYDHVIATGETGSYKNTVTALSANPAVVCELMVQLAQDDPSFLHSALAWLVPAIPELLRPFQVVLLASEPLNDGDIEELAAHGRSCVRAVLKAACDRNRLHLVLDAFISWLNSQSTLDHDDWTYWARQFGDLNPADPKTQAAVDVLLMVVGAVPTKMTHVPDSRWSAYVDGFMRAWTRPWTGDHRTALLPGMCMHLHGISWQAHPGRADGVVQLVERLIAISTPGEGTYLTQILVESLHTSPSLAADLYAKGWLEQRREEGARLPASDPEAATVTPPEPPLKAGQNADQIIGALVDAHRSGRELDQAFEPLVANGAIGDATTARTVISRLPIALLESGASPAQANAWTLALADRMANGTCGTRLATDFSRVMMESVPDEVRFVLKLLETVARDGSDGPPELTSRNRNMLTESLKDLQRVLRRAQPESTSPAGLNWVRSGPKNDPTARKTR